MFITNEWVFQLNLLLYSYNPFVFPFAAVRAFVNQMAGIYNRTDCAVYIYRNIYH